MHLSEMYSLNVKPATIVEYLQRSPRRETAADLRFILLLASPLEI